MPALKVCSRCPNLVERGVSMCPSCRSASDKQRNQEPRGYTTKGHHNFRAAVLARDPICKMCGTAWATQADHYPLSRRELEAAGLNADDPMRGRGLCAACHSKETTQHQPGGWNAR
jgi:5-methylcytosine-specific restriction enzyme A